MPTTKYYYDGESADNIMSITREAVLAVLEESLETAGLTIGEEDDELDLLVSADAAYNRYQQGGAFAYLLQLPAKTTRHQVLGHDDDAAHSGRKHEWQFMIQVSKGKIEGKVTPEQRAEADHELMDIVRSSFEKKFLYFRDELFFSGLQINPAGQAQQNSNILNPMTLTFYNLTRMAEDELL